MTFSIRPTTQADFPAVVALDNQTRSTPGTVAELQYYESLRPVDVPWLSLVAEVEGQVVAAAMGGGVPYLPADSMTCRVMVDPGWQRQGIGAALYGQLERFFREHRPATLRSTVRDDQPASLAWAEHRGFVRHHHIFDSHMNPSQLDLSPFDGRLAQIQADGYRFIHFDELRSAETERRLYDLFAQLMADVPDAADRHQAPFEAWCQWFLSSPGSWLSGCILAVDREGDWAGVTAMMRKPDEPTRVSIAVTGIVRAHRGRGLALALKITGIEYLRSLGVTDVVTNNHSANGPMLAVNRKLGYIPMPGKFHVIRRCPW